MRGRGVEELDVLGHVRGGQDDGIAVAEVPDTVSAPSGPTNEKNSSAISS